ncbi:hypothetical protein SAG0136_09315 [Streptococcus agalactiae LMG 14747]|uniref:Polysaccharide biosynthesis protein n=2 Tax=Streptococcus TaxID=1301 RepID=V6Z710_STRAG|nr:hypothetical protein SAG0136_09315 [Streptococcus agalactiae LMG 14747]SNV41373.1 exopolysaccharide biosynthesis protein, membrane protein [Streptococcus acidominimus]
MLTRMQYIKTNVIYGLVSRIVFILLEFIARFYFIKFLGNELLGITNVFINILQVLSVAELGLNNVVMYSYFKPLAQNDYKKLSHLNGLFRYIYNCIAATIFILGMCILPFVHMTISLDNANYNVYWIFFLFLIDSVLSYLFVYKTIILSAAQKNYIISKYDMICNSIRTVLQIVVLVTIQSFTVYFLLKIIFNLVANLLKVRIVDKEYPEISNHNGKISKVERNEIFDTIKSGLIYKISGVLLNGTDNIIISSFIGTVYVGLLSNYTILATSIMSFIVVIFSSMTSSVGNLLHTEDKRILLDRFERIQSVANWLSIVLMTCLFLLSSDFISLWIGKEYIMDSTTVLWLTMVFYLGCFLQPIYIFREATGLFQKTKYVMLITAILNCILSIILVNLYGVDGVLLATLISKLMTYFWYEPLVLFRDIFDASPKQYFIEVFKNFIITFLLMVLLYIFPIAVKSWMDWILKGLFIFILSNLAAFMLYNKKLGISRLIIEKLKNNIR